MDARPGQRSLDPDFVLEAYTAGFFPMADPGTGQISWYSPDPRTIVPLNEFHIPRSLRAIIRKGIFEVRVDTAFEDVITGCSRRDETWISDEVKQVFLQLHSRGLAHSIEAWQGGVLAGGLYGLALHGAFFGESMFSVVSNASKVALVHLVDHLRRRRFIVLDVQYMTRHLAGFGAVETSRAVYMKILIRALQSKVTFGPRV